MNTEEKISKAKHKLRKECVFLGGLIVYSRTTFLSDEDAEAVATTLWGPPDPAYGDQCRFTACIDETGEMTLARRYVDESPLMNVVALMAHEIMHLALFTRARRKNRDRRLWNIASDIKINEYLAEAGMDPYLPPDGAHVRHDRCILPGKDGETVHVIYNVSEKSAEQIYEELLKKQKESPKGKLPVVPGITPHAWDYKDLDNMSPEEKAKADDTARFWARAVTAAANEAARARGTLPGELEITLDDMLNPQIPWEEALTNTLDKSVITDTTYKRPRRSSYSLPDGLLLPSVLREGCAIIYHLDSSGSMSTEDIKLGLGALRNFMERYPGARAKVLVGDAAINGVFDVDSEDDILAKVRLVGRGGTSHKPLTKWVNTRDNLEEFEGQVTVVAFTDGMSDIEEAFPQMNAGINKVLVLTSKHMSETLAPYADTLIVAG